MYVNRTALSYARLWFKLKSLPPFKCTLERPRSQYKICFGFLGVCVVILSSGKLSLSFALWAEPAAWTQVFASYSQSSGDGLWLKVRTQEKGNRSSKCFSPDADVKLFQTHLQPQRLRNGRIHLQRFKKTAKAHFQHYTTVKNYRYSFTKYAFERSSPSLIWQPRSRIYFGQQWNAQ